MAKLDHWRNPRATIANYYENNDYGYVFHAVSLFKSFLTISGITLEDLKSKKILDYGCGTGRVTRVFAMFCQAAVGYDPVKECIDEAFKEDEKIGKSISARPKIFTTDISELSNDYDIIVSINVFEHLDFDDSQQALNNIACCLRDQGECFLWLHSMRNRKFLDENNIPLSKTPIGVFGIKGTKQQGRIIF